MIYTFALWFLRVPQVKGLDGMGTKVDLPDPILGHRPQGHGIAGKGLPDPERSALNQVRPVSCTLRTRSLRPYSRGGKVSGKGRGLNW